MATAAEKMTAPSRQFEFALRNNSAFGQSYCRLSRLRASSSCALSAATLALALDTPARRFSTVAFEADSFAFASVRSARACLRLARACFPRQTVAFPSGIRFAIYEKEGSRFRSRQSNAGGKS
jgi:hypothetical protein